jgi:hypothetical protein
VTPSDLIALGFAPVEVHTVTDDGACTCFDRHRCSSPGKHAVGRGWMKSALRRRERSTFVPAFVRLAPITSYGLVPPPGSGLIVIDRDDPDALLPLPETFEVHRGSAPERKGHYYYRLARDIDEGDVPRAFAGGEVRVCASGYVVGPGSRHPSGDLYHGNGAPTLGTADRELVDALRALKPVRRGSDGTVEAVLGSRRAWLVGQARKFAGWGYDEDEIVEELRALNESTCQPPLDDREFADVVRGAHWAVTNVAPDDGMRVALSREPRTWEVVVRG